MRDMNYTKFGKWAWISFWFVVIITSACFLTMRVLLGSQEVRSLKTQLAALSTTEKETACSGVNIINAPVGANFVFYCEKIDVNPESGVTLFMVPPAPTKKK